MSAGTLPDEAFGLALDAFAGTFADGTPLTVTEALLQALLAAAPLIADQKRRQIRRLAVDTNATCEGDGVTYPFADILGEP